MSAFSKYILCMHISLVAVTWFLQFVFATDKKKMKMTQNHFLFYLS